MGPRITRLGFALSVPPSPARGSPRALSSAGQTPACPGSLFQLFLFKEKGKKAISFLLSRSGNFRPSLEQPLSACTGSARPRDRRQDPPPPFCISGLGLGGDFSLFPEAGLSPRLSLSEETGLSPSVPACGCCQGGVWGLGTLLAPLSPRLDSQLRSESLRAPFHRSRVFAVPGIARSQLPLPFVSGCLRASVSVPIFSL